jgi:hypothetical protein
VSFSGTVAKSLSASGLIAVVATFGLLVGACGSSSPSSKAPASPSPTPKATTIANVDACILVTAADASTATGVTVSNLSGSAGVQIPGACIYSSADGTTTVFVIAQAYPDATSANAVSPEQLAAALNGAYGIANAKTVSGIGDKAVEYTVSSAASGSTGTVIFVFKANVVMMIAVTPTTDSTAVENLARTAVGRL